MTASPSPQSDASRRPVRVLIGLAVVLLIAALVHVGVGSFITIAPGDILREILQGPGGSGRTNSVIWDLRLPRAVLCALVGAVLAVVGSAFQALLRNPLGDPYIVGVSSGAAVGGCLALVMGFGTALNGFGMDAAGFGCGMLSLGLVYGLAKRRGVVDVRTLLLSGVVVGSLLSALLSVVLLAAGKDTNVVLRWLLGDTSMATWSKDALLVAAFVVGSGILFSQSRRLNAFALGSGSAQRLGVDVSRLTRTALICGTAMTAVAVGAVGIIGFLGLVAPHIARRIVGVDWRWSLPASSLVGAVLLLASDVIAQRALSLNPATLGQELPVGVVTAIVGAPSLLILLRRA